ncbi:hypothetical protein BC830DRAFT_361324 [Chytriomyces sp. MP71]|nr:hypothetical protein BC830DRAFT_361324 [Chytriomyces sp. MP71]
MREKRMDNENERKTMAIPDTIRAYFIDGLLQTTLALALNLMVLLGNAPHLRSLPPSSFLIFWLCVSDAGINTITIYLIAAQVLTNKLGVEVLQCQVLAFFTTLFALAGLCLCAGLTLFRYLVVVRQWNLSSNFAPVYVIGVFVAATLVVALPFTLGSADVTYGISSAYNICTVLWFDTHTETKIMVWLYLAVLAIPFNFIGFAYASIYLEMRKSVREMEGNLSTPETRMASAKGSTGDSGVGKEHDKMHTLLYQSIALVAVFIMGWTPNLGKILYEMINNVNASSELEFMTEVFMTLMHILNPVVVMIFDVEMRLNVFRAFSFSSVTTLLNKQ